MKQSCSSCKKLSYRQLLISFGAALLAFGWLSLGTGTIRAKNTSCIPRDKVIDAGGEGKCLVIFGDKVYDLTLAKKWDLTGHVGKHLCGKEYDQQTIEQGPHKIGVMEKFVSGRLCQPNESPTEEKIIVGGIMGMTWFRFSAYLSLVFFIFNFATCYAMPWASVKEPWKGDRPGKDKKDVLGSFPLTHWHKVWAWLAIFALSFHGILGFVGVLFGKWY